MSTSVILWNAYESDDYICISIPNSILIMKGKKTYKRESEEMEVAVLDILTLLTDVMFLYSNLIEVFISFDKNALMVKSEYKGEEHTDCFNYQNINLYRKDIYNILGIENDGQSVDVCYKQIFSQKPMKKDYFVISKIIDEHFDRKKLVEKAEEFHRYYETLSHDEQVEVFTDFIGSLKAIDSLDTYLMKKSKKEI